ncbi:hypothetical protein [Ruminococcus sp. HUN007]|uniref:hypothetical protein n=1 Tax=Ruminococcus sp. HUN007 TaxID=1514668 RepID=UPI0012DC1CE4|nr:hypothetical protein [Ruminococcus sp. HUN007]
MKKKILSLGTAFIMAVMAGTQPLNVFASELNTGLQYEESEFEKAEGLISKYYLSIDNDNGDVSITAQTKSNSVMAVIGFKNISVQYSSDCINWTEEVHVSDKLNYNSTGKTLAGFPVSVVGNRYYRVQLNHYANNGSGTTQTIPNISNVIRIS